MGFKELIYALDSLGIADVLLPFLLIFTIVYAVLQKSQPLGEKKEFNVVIALIMGLLVVIPHVMGWYPPDSNVVLIINTALPNIAVVLVAILMVLMLVGIFGGKASWGGALSGWVALIAFVLVAYIFGRAAGWFEYLPQWLYWLDDSSTQAILVVAAVFALIINWIVKDEKPKEGSGEKLIKGLGELFGGK